MFCLLSSSTHSHDFTAHIQSKFISFKESEQSSKLEYFLYTFCGILSATHLINFNSYICITAHIQSNLISLKEPIYLTYWISFKDTFQCCKCYSFEDINTLLSKLSNSNLTHMITILSLMYMCYLS